MRQRPAGGGIVFFPDENSFLCEGCGERSPIGAGWMRHPEWVAITRERLVDKHAACWEFDNAPAAAAAMRHERIRKRGRELRERAARALDRFGFRNEPLTERKVF